MLRERFSMLTVVLISLFICNFADAAVRFDPDVGGKTYVTKITNFHSDNPVQIHLVAIHAVPFAFIRHEYVSIEYCEPKSESNLLIYNDRIDFNYCYQLPSCRIRADSNNRSTLLA